MSKLEELRKARDEANEKYREAALEEAVTSIKKVHEELNVISKKVRQYVKQGDTSELYADALKVCKLLRQADDPRIYIANVHYREIGEPMPDDIFKLMAPPDGELMGALNMYAINHYSKETFTPAKEENPELREKLLVELSELIK